jgi:hypothetical protein
MPRHRRLAAAIEAAEANLAQRRVSFCQLVLTRVPAPDAQDVACLSLVQQAAVSALQHAEAQVRELHALRRRPVRRWLAALLRGRPGRRSQIGATAMSASSRSAQNTRPVYSAGSSQAAK